MLGANGDVSAPPTSDPTYGYVTSESRDVSATGQTVLTSPPFVATAGQDLSFYFNYVTSDGAGFTDYAGAVLRDVSDNSVAYLFTARTTPSGNTVPSAGDPAVVSRLLPSVTPILPGKTNWAPLGADSASCWAVGCGSTGWIQAFYNIPKSGTYVLSVYVANEGDGVQHSGLAVAAVSVGAPTLVAVASVAVPSLSHRGLLTLISLMVLAGVLSWRYGRLYAASNGAEQP